MAIAPDRMMLDDNSGMGSQAELDNIYNTQIVGTTGKTQAQLDAATNAAQVATMTGQTIDPKTGYVVPKVVPDPLKDKSAQPKAPAGFHYTWIGGTTTGSWTLYKDSVVAGGVTPGGGGGNGATPAGATGAKTVVSVLQNKDGTSTTYFSDGTQAISGTPTPDTVSQSAIDIVNGFLKDAGMDALSKDVWSQWTSGTTSGQIMDYIRSTPQYAARFPAMAALNKAGRNISEAAYIYKEQSDVEYMKQYGITNPAFLTHDYLGKLIENNVTTVDLQSRLMAAQDTVMSYDPNVVKYAKDVFGLAQGDLMAWALDPTKALPGIQQQAKAIQIGGAAFAAGIAASDITQAEASSLAAAGVTQAQAQQGFTNVAQMGQYSQALPGANPAETVSSQDLINAQFATSPDAITKLQKAKQSKLAEYAQGGQFAATQAGVVGLGNAPVI